MKIYLAAFVLLLSVTTNAQEYKRLHRTYVDLSQLDLHECKRSFRLLHGNYMDCKLDLPQGEEGAPLTKIDSGQFMSTSVALTANVSGHEAYISMQDTARDYIDGSLFTHLVFTMYYRLPDRPGYMQTLPAENYGWPVFEKFLRQALAKISKERAWKTSSPIIALPWNNTAVEEHIIGSIYVAMNTTPLKVEDCQSSLTTKLVDAWPAEDYWITTCSFGSRPSAYGGSLPLDASYWSESLQAAAKNNVSNGGMTLNYSASGWNLVIWGKHEWNEIADQVRDTFSMIGTKVDGYYIVDENVVNRYGGPDWTLGKLAYKNGKIDIIPNPSR